MKIIVAGGRDFSVKNFLYDKLEDLFWDHEMDALRPDLMIVSGGAKGADSLGEAFAKSWDIPSKVFPADWECRGKAAGILRNIEMAEYADVLVAFWDGKSRGTQHMIDVALKEGLEVHVYRYTSE